MAAALLGKCVGLLALVVLHYTCCYAFRIREHGAQIASPAIMQAHRDVCNPIFGRCTERPITATTSMSSATRKWHEPTVPRGASTRKLPVEVTSSDDDDDNNDNDDDDDGGKVGTEGVRMKFERTGYYKDGVRTGPTTKSPKIESIEVDDDDDEDEAVVEVEDESGEVEVEMRSEQVAEDSAAEDDQSDDERDDEEEGDDDEVADGDHAESDEKKGESYEEQLKVRNKKRDTLRDDEDKDERKETNEAFRKRIDGVKLSSKKADTRSKAGKSSGGTIPTENEHEEDESEQRDLKKGIIAEKDSGKTIKRAASAKKRETDDEDSTEDTDEEEEDDEVSTPPPRKLEKVRHADKDKLRSVEKLPSTPVPEKPKVEAKKPSESAKKQEDVTKKPTEGAKKLIDNTGGTADDAKKSERTSKITKSEVETSKVKTTSKPAESAKTVVKPEENTKSPEKPEAPKVLPKTKDSVKTPEKPKVKSVNPKVTPGKPIEILRSDKKASMPKTKTGVGGPISLSELNDAILRVPTFVPNFTAVEDVECQRHGKIFLRQLRGYKLWAMQMLDASAKIPSGLLHGNVNQFGNFDECLGVMAHVKVDDKTIKVQGKYCLASIDIHASHPEMKLPVNLMQSRAVIRGNRRDSGHFIAKFTTVKWALCVPAACSDGDVENIIERALGDYNVTTGIRFAVDVDPNMCYVKQKTRSYSKETIGVLYFYATVVCFVIVATVRDSFVVSEGKGNYPERIIMSFSLRRTVKALLKEGSNSSDILCIHGIRTFSTIAIYVAHRIIPITMLPYANRNYLSERMNHPISSFLRVGAVYTDGFLVLSGVLTAYNMTYEFTRRGEIRWFCRCITRYVRLTPALLAIVFWYAFVMEHIGSGPLWNSVIMINAEICKSNAWTNLLYIQNFFPFEEICATHTHQLALDMQLSLLAPILVFFLRYKTIVGVLIIFFFILLSATLRYIATVSNYLSLIVFHGITTKMLLKSANLSYILPLHRVTGYVFGIGIGVLLHYTGRNVKIHKVLVIFGWLIALALGSWTLFSPGHLARRDYVYDVEEMANYAVLCPFFWSLTICWIIFACHTNNGGIINKFLSNYWFVVCSRISYAVYLTQFAVFFYNVGSARYPAEFQTHRIIDLFEVATVIAASIVLTLLFDLPMQDIKNVIMESTDSLNVEATADKQSIAKDEDKTEKLVKEEVVEETDFGEDEKASAKWGRQKDTVQGVTSMNDAVEEIFTKTEGKRTAYEPARKSDWIKVSNKTVTNDSEVYALKGRKSRDGQNGYSYDSEEEALEYARIQQEREEAVRRRRRSLSRSRDGKRMSARESDDEEEHRRRREEEEEADARQYRRSESRGRSVARESDDYRSWEFISNERSSFRGPDGNIVAGKSEECRLAPKQTRPPERVTRPIDGRGTFTSETDEDPLSQRKKAQKKHHPVEVGISDEEDWENELRIRRQQFMQKLSSEQREILGDEEFISLKRRSSAEGRIALLKDPSGDGNMDAWTVSVGPRIAQLGSSQEPSEPEDDNAYLRRREYRERAPPSRDDTQSEEEVIWDSSRRRSETSGSQITSMEEDDDIPSYDFVLTKDSKRISVQDLSKLSQEDADAISSGNNVVKNEGTKILPKSTSLGLFKRESIIKSQASEEDPEYLLPERPKLVQQEREHPFKKAWQMQKSRSEDDGSSPYAIRESKEQQIDLHPTDSESSSITRELSGEQSEDVGSLADDESELITLSTSRSSDTEENRTSSKSEDIDSVSTEYRKSPPTIEDKGNSIFNVDEDSPRFNWPTEDEQFEVYKTSLRRKSDDTDWSCEYEET